MAPELIEKRPYRGTSVDIFAAGVVLFIMATGTMPFDRSASTFDILYRYIIEKKYDLFWKAWEETNESRNILVVDQSRNLSPAFKDLIVRMLSYCYSERPSIDEIK